MAGSTVQVSGASPFDATCGLAGQTGTNYPNSEVEPYVDVNPNDGANLIGAWQQDRWSNGGSRGNVVGASLDNGATWQIVAETKNSQCTGGTTANGGDYERASDPWVTISPNGTRLPDEPVHRSGPHQFLRRQPRRHARQQVHRRRADVERSDHAHPRRLTRTA